MTTVRWLRDPAHFAVCVMVLLALVLRLFAAQTLTVHYDEHWHIFAGAAQPLRQFLDELRELAHPPLSYVALRLLLRFGDTGSHLLARMLGIVPALLSLPVVYVCARRLQLGRPLALFGVLLMALSPAHIVVSILTRGYSLATLFVLLAYATFLGLLRAPEAARKSLLRATLFYSALAMWTEYSAWFAIAAMLMVPLLARRRELLLADKKALRWFGLSALLLLGYLTWSVGMGSYGHIAPNLPDGGPLWRFALLGLARDLHLFSSLNVSLLAAFLILAGASVVLLPGTLLALRGAADLPRASAPLICGQLLVLLFLLALIRIYPFGGEVRHQFVLFPFMLFSLLLIVERGLRTVHATLRGALCALSCAAALYWASWAARQPMLEPPNWLPEWPRDVGGLLRASAQEPIYVSGYSAYGLSGSLPGMRWQVQASCGKRCQRFVATHRNGQSLTVIKDSALWDMPPFTDEKFSAHLHEVMRLANLQTLWVYSLASEPQPSERPRIEALYQRLGLHAKPGPKLAIGETWRISAHP